MEGWGLGWLVLLIYLCWVSGAGGCWLIRRACGTRVLKARYGEEGAVERGR